MKPFRIFIVEDDFLAAETIYLNLSSNPEWEVEKFENGSDCLANLHRMPSMVTVDYELPDMTGDQLMKKILEHDPAVGVIFISGQRDIATAIELLKKGAFDYMVKGEISRERLWNAARLIRETQRLKAEKEGLLREVGKKFESPKELVGSSHMLRELYERIDKAASSSINVSVSGETGTGKEMVAKSIHYQSERRNRPFVAVNVGAIPAELIESELFGHEKGAFTGAVSRRSGLFEKANGGTLFLDEIGDMDQNMQVKLLRALQEREIRRVGGNEEIKIDVRLITATHKDLAGEVKKGNFRKDLFYRVMGLPIHLTPLRDRGSDIILLARYFATEYIRDNHLPPVTFTCEAINKLMTYSYPGNVRELKAIVELAAVLCENQTIDAQHITFNTSGSKDDLYDENMTLDGYIVKIIKLFLQKNGQNPTLAARKLGIGRATMYRYIKNYGL